MDYEHLIFMFRIIYFNSYNIFDIAFELIYVYIYIILGKKMPALAFSKIIYCDHSFLPWMIKFGIE